MNVEFEGSPPDVQVASYTINKEPVVETDSYTLAVSSYNYKMDLLNNLHNFEEVSVIEEKVEDILGAIIDYVRKSKEI